MTEKNYEIKLENYNGKATLRNYLDQDKYFKSPVPTTLQDEKIVRRLTRLVEELDLKELNVKIEVK